MCRNSLQHRYIGLRNSCFDLQASQSVFFKGIHPTCENPPCVLGPVKGASDRPN